MTFFLILPWGAMESRFVLFSPIKVGLSKSERATEEEASNGSTGKDKKTGFGNFTKRDIPLKMVDLTPWT